MKAQASPTTETLQFVDAATGADRSEVVDWRTALQLKVAVSRARPCGYWLGPDQGSAVSKLQALGVTVIALGQERKAVVEAYRVLTEKGGQRVDARGLITTNTEIRVVTVALDKSTMTLPAGGWYVSLNQAMGGLIAAALEPDSQNSYTANHVMGMGERALLRVLQFLD